MQRLLPESSACYLSFFPAHRGAFWSFEKSDTLKKALMLPELYLSSARMSSWNIRTGKKRRVYLLPEQFAYDHGQNFV